ncbi:MAG: molybdate ABC transporter substrate-binding protein [Myxococcales bacterium]|nr:molybdate ABC transporter substrate-binding protein [Myxococcales bacterium]
MIRNLAIFALLLACGLASPACSKPESKKLQVAAASSLAGALESVGKAYAAKTGTEISLILSSSGKLRQQILEGAPYDVFVSANLAYLKDLEASGDVSKGSVSVYAEGRLAMWVKTGDAPADLAALASSSYEHIAIANPEHAPYGTAARQAMQSEKLWSKLESRVVRGSSVRQAMQYAESGNAEVALVAHSLALHGGGAFTLIPASMHAPLQQGIGIVAKTPRGAAAEAFVQFLESAEGAALLKPYGLQARR